MSGPNGADGKRDPVDLVLEDGSEVAVLFGGDPDVAVAPAAEVPQFLHFGMRVLDVVLDGELAGIVDADVAAEAEEDAGGFVGEEAGKRSVGVAEREN